MKKTYETLDEYLDDLDKIKEAIAHETEGMDAGQIRDYFARARHDLEKATGRKVCTRRTHRKMRTTAPKKADVSAVVHPSRSAGGCGASDYNHPKAVSMPVRSRPGSEVRPR